MYATPEPQRSDRAIRTAVAPVIGQDNLVPGTWPNLSTSAYRRLIRLAMRRIHRFEASAEDVVCRALIRWESMDSQNVGTARIEQVIKSEALSLVRSEDRRRDRETRSFADRSRRPEQTVEMDLMLLIADLEDAADRTGIAITEFDREVLDLLLEERSMTDVTNVLGSTRHRVRRARGHWQILYQHAGFDDKRSSPVTIT